MTPAQQTILKADIISAGNAAALAAFIAAEDWPSVAIFYNTLFSPPVLLWRPAIPVSAICEEVDWEAFVALTVQKQNTYLGMTAGGAVNATKLGIRKAFVAIFGVGAATTVALTTLAQAPATRFQALFASGGVSSVFGQTLTGTDVQQAMLLP